MGGAGGPRPPWLTPAPPALPVRDYLREDETFSWFLRTNTSLPPELVDELMGARLNPRIVSVGAAPAPGTRGAGGCGMTGRLPPVLPGEHPPPTEGCGLQRLGAGGLPGGGRRRFHPAPAARALRPAWPPAPRHGGLLPLPARPPPAPGGEPPAWPDAGCWQVPGQRPPAPPQRGCDPSSHAPPCRNS